MTRPLPEGHYPSAKSAFLGGEAERLLAATPPAGADLRAALDVDRLAPLLAREFGKAGFFRITATMDFLTRQARMMLDDIAAEYAALATPRAAPALDVERLARALGGTYGEEGWRLVLMSEDGGVVPTALPSAFVEALAAEYARLTDEGAS